MQAIEEIINLKELTKSLDDIIKAGNLKNVMNEIILQCKIEFNYINDD